jgi:hypothetical protein
VASAGVAVRASAARRAGMRMTISFRIARIYPYLGMSAAQR